MHDWVDTHCHLDARELGWDASAVTARSRAAGLAQCVIPAVARSNWTTVRTLAESEGWSYALGIHPMCTNDAADEDLAELDREIAVHRDDPRLVAVGEIGLDHFVPGLDPARQARFYRAQLELAAAHRLPVLLHVRRSADQLLKQLRQVPATGIAHAFNGSRQQAFQFIDLGFKLGFGGNVTYARALQIRRLAALVPLDAIVLETDSPDIPPRWLYRTAEERTAGAAQGINEPSELPAIGAVLAGLRGIEADELAAATTRNAIAALPRLAALLRAAAIASP